MEIRITIEVINHDEKEANRQELAVKGEPATLASINIGYAIETALRRMMNVPAEDANAGDW